MPSGAKKRKAAKKKLQKEANNTTNYDGSHSLGNDNAKSHDERDSDGGERERESSEERAVSNHEEEALEGCLGEQNVAEFSEEVKSEENCNDVKINAVDDVTETKNGHNKRSSASSSSSSSDDDEVTVEEEKSVAAEAGELEQQVQNSFPEASRENSVISEVIDNSVEESIPVEESVKEVVSLPQEENAGNESADVENSVSSHVIESELKQNLDDVLPSAAEKEDKVSSGVTEFLEKIETKVIEVVNEGAGKLSGSEDVAARDGEGLLPQSSGVMSADTCCGDNHVKKSETHKYVEEKPLVSSAPLPVQRTSWMNCCGLFEVFSVGASR